MNVFRVLAVFVFWSASSSLSVIVSGSALLKNTENQWKYIQFDNDGSGGHTQPQSSSRFGYAQAHALPSGYQSTQGHAHAYPSTAGAGGARGTPEFVRPARQLNLGPNTYSPNANSILQSAGVSISDYGSGSGYGGSDLEFGGLAAAGGHGGGGYGGGGGGGGYGHGKKQDCNSALGLLGVLGLMSFLQSVLSQLTSTAAPAGGGRRKKRDVSEGDGDDIQSRSPSDVNVDRVTLHILPYLIRVGQVVDSVAPLNCSLHAICTTNHILATELEPSQGQIVGRMMTKGILNMLSQKYGSTGIDKHKHVGVGLAEIANAAIVGRAGNDGCQKQFPECTDVPETNLPGFISLHSSF